MAAARELVMIRCGLDADQALTYLANYATMCGLTVDAAARQLLSSATTAPAPTRSADLTQIIPGPNGPEDHQAMRTVALGPIGSA